MQRRLLAVAVLGALVGAVVACSGSTPGQTGGSNGNANENANANANGNGNANDNAGNNNNNNNNNNGAAACTPYTSEAQLAWASFPTAAGDACQAPAPQQVFTTPAAASSVRAASAATGLWWNGAVVYQIWTRSFRDGAKNDGVGDLAGITDRLPYLKDLGVDAIWLSPIYPSPSYHGYDVTSYDDVKPDYDPNWVTGGTNTNSDFDKLIAAAHAAGLKVLLDFVPNHSSNQHPWFRDSAASLNGKRDWYVWSPTDLGWAQPWGSSSTSCSGCTWHLNNGSYYYGAFNGGMPDLNWDNPAVAQAIQDAAVRWVQRGVDGFRLDAVRYLVETGPGPGQSDQPGTHTALQGFTAAVRAAKSDALVYGEAWTDLPGQAPYLGSAASQATGGDEVLPFNFALSGVLVGGNATGIGLGLDAVANLYPSGSADAPFLTNHDMVRAATVVGNDVGRMKASATLLLTLQGTPVVYYGEELGMQNGAGGDDRAKRSPMPWDACANHGFTAAVAPWYGFSPGADAANVVTEATDPGSLLVRYRKLLALRKASSALRTGNTTHLDTSTASDGWSRVVAFLRSDGTETVLVAVNTGPDTTQQALAIDATSVEPLLNDDCAALHNANGTWTVTLGPTSAGIWRLH